VNGEEPSRAPSQRYPGPLSALLLTFCAVLLTGISIGLLGFAPDAGVFGIAEAIGLGVTGSLAARRVPPPHASRLGLTGFDPQFATLIVLLVPVIVLNSELDNLLRANEVMQRAPWTEAPLLNVLQDGIVAIALMPVVEEWFFRGVLQQGLVDTFGRFGGVLYTAGLYALLRLNPSEDQGVAIAAFIGALATGCLLGLLRIATGSILAPILLSSGISAAYLLADAYSDVFPIAGFTAPGNTPFNVLLPAGLAVAWGVSQLLAAVKAAPEDQSDDSEPEEGAV